ncbi:unnamed protein product [Rotaria magnacalcarata]|uniref:Uncharacterized protein n=1 Tax=Rotaria magnacalcarata TaxID=392030 RepID=A0A816R6X5_9BILA|nr:unnamed protein product [Rotaria magnacalcarata]CAF2043663.1 unnamed protein product [Rotaria magnacalcarata]CAF2069800.1 unnamed protein product [Rotaria magnacalcarata]CAF3789167.1 unnamed protein product [Rotaria magnacalcarata]CAF3818691.1 unnamed protein product [Rotaria magnacalcarata]
MSVDIQQTVNPPHKTPLTPVPLMSLTSLNKLSSSPSFFQQLRQYHHQQQLPTSLKPHIRFRHQPYTRTTPTKSSPCHFFQQSSAGSTVNINDPAPPPNSASSPTPCDINTNTATTTSSSMI